MRGAESFVCFSFLAPVQVCDVFIADLWEVGILGLQTSTDDPEAGIRQNLQDGLADSVRLDIWSLPAPEGAVEEVGEAWLERGVTLLGVSRVSSEDWMAGWREHTAPFPLGRRFTIDPGEIRSPTEDRDASRRVLHLPARQAFGTGSHESTRLIAEWLEDLPIAGKTVLDVGTGTGILGFVSGTLGARTVVGIDTDVDAALAGVRNRVRNRLAMHFATGGVECVRGTFDFVLVNILPHSILEHVQALAERLSDGWLIYSGAIAAEEARVVAALESADLRVVERRQAGEWRALLAHRRAT
jgi:ribosomal protein L11 methyltransferase